MVNLTLEQVRRDDDDISLHHVLDLQRVDVRSSVQGVYSELLPSKFANFGLPLTCQVRRNDDKGGLGGDIAFHVLDVLEILLDVRRSAVDEPERDCGLSITDLIGENSTTNVVRTLSAALRAPSKRLEYRLGDLLFDKGWRRLRLLLKHPGQ